MLLTSNSLPRFARQDTFSLCRVLTDQNPVIVYDNSGSCGFTQVIVALAWARCAGSPSAEIKADEFPVWYH